jgi:hypothetical protein
MIKLSLAELVNMQSSLRELTKIKMPVKASYNLMKLLKKVDAELLDFESQKLQLFEKYGTRVEDELRIEKDSLNYEKFATDMNDLLAVEVEFKMERIKMSDLGSHFVIDVNDLLLMEKLFDLEEAVEV